MAKKTTTKSTPPPEIKPAAESPAKTKAPVKPSGKTAAPAAPPATVAPAKSTAPPAPLRESVLAPAKKAAAPKAAPPKATAPTKPPATAKPTAKKAAPKKPGYTQEDVALRAYYISEKRRTHHLPGDEAHDWIEAERQLAKEFGGGKMAKKG